MTETPWGEARLLRERMLAGGPRVSAEAAAENQRERLFGAMVAVCAERGYEATRVSDVVALSGVSRRDFYRHFADREDCFGATLDAIIAVAFKRTDDAPSASAALRRLIEFASLQPAATRLCLIDSFAAGVPAIARMDAALARSASIYERALSESGRDGALPIEARRAIIGGIREVIQKRLREDRAGELPGLTEPLLGWALGYDAPPAPLPRPQLPRGAPGSYLPEDPAERLIAGLSEAIAAHGYQATTINEIVARAGVSLSTFYEHFDSKRAVLLAALDSGRARFTGVAMPPFRRGRDWPSSVRAAFEAMYAFLAAEPVFARASMVEVFAAGEEALEQRERTMAFMRTGLEPGFELAPELDRVIAEAIGGATARLAYEEIRRSGPEGLPRLAPLATYLTLAPFLGAEEAAAVARRRR
jgi:AcrR family transcriptional regulator